MKFLNTMETVDRFATQTFAASFTPDITASSVVKVTLTGNITSLNAPTGRAFGKFTVVFVQDATGGRTVTWSSAYPDFNSSSWNPNLAANAVSSVSFFYDENSSVWRPFDSFNGDLWAFVTTGTSNTASKIKFGNGKSLSVNASGAITTGTGDLTGSNITATSNLISATVAGDTASGGNMTLKSTTNATKGKIYFGNTSASAYDEVNNRLGVGNTSPSVALDVTGAANVSTNVQTPIVQGGTGSGGSLTLKSTTNATKGTIVLGAGSVYDDANTRLGIGNFGPATALDVTGAGTFSSTVTHAEPTSSTHSATKNYVDTGGSTKLKGRASSNQTGMTSTTYADVTSLAVTLPSTGYYRFQAYIPYQAASGTSPTITFGVTGPTAVVCQYNVNVQTAAAGTTSVFTAGSYLQNTTQSSSIALTTTFGAIVDGFVEVSATGTLKIQYKVGGTTPSITVLAGAMFLAEKVLY